MLQKTKISVAYCICIAFIFRLFIVNLALVPSFTIQKNNHLTVNKNINNVVFSKMQNSSSYTDEEIFEEDLDDENPFSLDVSYIVRIFYSAITSKIENQLKNITSFNKHFSYSSTHRFIEFGVFRL